MEESLTMGNRVAERTSPAVNARIQRSIEASVVYYAQNPDQIDARLHELAREWDIERVLEANAASLSLYGLLVGLIGRRYRLLLLPLAVAGFLLQHAIQGWCPPIMLFRRIGFRTSEEIQLERTALRALKGDLERLCAAKDREVHERAMETVAVLRGA